MLNEYTLESLQKSKRFFNKLKANLTRDYRTESAQKAFFSIFQNLPDNALCVSVGARRDHPELVNVNIAPFPNVDIAADAHKLPYDDGCVDVIHCEAVLEPLQYPQIAIKEMWRVFKARLKIICLYTLYASIPWLPSSLSKFYNYWSKKYF